MARGWESKAVEAQQDEATQEALRPDDAPVKFKDTPEERTRRDRITSLQLSRNNTLEKLDHAANPNYRQMLLRALSALDQELEELTSADPSAGAPVVVDD